MIMKKQTITLLLSIILCQNLYADSGWQSYLENNANFSYVFTFENFDDWQPSSPANGDNFNPSLQPTSSGSPTRLVGFQYWTTDTPSDVWIGDHGTDYTLRDKSLQMTFSSGVLSNDSVGPSMALFYIGNGTASSGTRNDGFETLHAFYAIKFRRQTIDLIGSGYSWEPTGTNNEYYLLYNSGNPNLPMPNTIVLNGSYVADPVTLGGSSMASQYPTRDDGIGSLAAGDWCYGDPASLGYETIIVRLSDDTDPDTKSSGYVTYQTGNFVQTSDTALQYLGVWKHTFAAQGFWYNRSTSPYLHYYDGTFSDGCTEPTETVYGNNFTILNMLVISGDLTIGTEDGLSAVGNYSTCYGYTPSNTGVSTFAQTTSDLIANVYIADQWMYVEITYDKGTCGNYDGSITVSYYNSTGSLLGTETHSNLIMCNDAGVLDLDNPYNQFHFGGNRLGTVYAYDSSDSWEMRYYIDDVIFDESEIATTYFSLLSSYTPGTVTCYKDTDGDLYSDGTSETGVESCSENYYESGHFTSLVLVDCDDTNAAISPGATEVCGDGVDNNCSGADATCGLVRAIQTIGTVQTIQTTGTVQVIN